MLLFDNHNHSQFSFDGGKTTVEKTALSAMGKRLGGICFTDHCDFYVPPVKAGLEKFVPETFDILSQQAEIDRTRRIVEEADCEHKPLILKGIEIGMHEICHQEIRQVLSSFSFDQVTASVHYLGTEDPYYGDYYTGRSWKEAYGTYLETIFKEMTWLGDFDVMAHYDYIVRYAPYPQTSIRYRDFADILDEMLLYLVHEGKALELNTKSYRECNGRKVELDTDILRRYRELGGEIISFGSDSHTAEDTGYDIPRHAELLKSLGFRWNAHFENRRLVQLPL